VRTVYAPWNHVAHLSELIPVLALPDSWSAGAHSAIGPLLGFLESIDRLCGQFATALQGAEHDHLFLLVALIGTLGLVFPTHR
jgi:hypothetical protein